jgi:hypothetical protein
MTTFTRECYSSLCVKASQAGIQMLFRRFVGDIIVAVNPFKALPIYSDDMLSMYVTAQGKGLAPHIFAIADNSYRDMMANQQNQVQ